MVSGYSRFTWKAQQEMVAGAWELSILPIDPASVLSEDNTVVMGRLAMDEALLALKDHSIVLWSVPLLCAE
jgi:hypothetical protein